LVRSELEAERFGSSHACRLEDRHRPSVRVDHQSLTVVSRLRIGIVSVIAHLLPEQESVLGREPVFGVYTHMLLGSAIRQSRTLGRTTHTHVLITAMHDEQPMESALALIRRLSTLHRQHRLYRRKKQTESLSRMAVPSATFSGLRFQRVHARIETYSCTMQ
jgi:hypothetical protein